MSPSPLMQQFKYCKASPNLFKITGFRSLKLSSLIINDNTDIISPPILPIIPTIAPIKSVIIINKAKTFHNMCVKSLQIHLQQQQLTHIFPEHRQIKNIKTASAILIIAKAPKANVTPSFP